MGGAGISVQTAAVSSMCSSGENLWSTPKSVVSPAGPPTNTTASSVRSHTSRGWRGDGGEEARERVRAPAYSDAHVHSVILQAVILPCLV